MIYIQSYKTAKDNIGAAITEAAAIALIAGEGAAGKALQMQIDKLRHISKHIEEYEPLQNQPDFDTSKYKKLKEEYSAGKLALMGVTFSGTFAQANVINKQEDRLAVETGKIFWPEIYKEKKYSLRTRAIEQHAVDSFLRVADIDKEVITGHTKDEAGKKIAIKTVQIASNEALQALKATICKDPVIRTCFISPGGNGLKIVFSIDAADTDSFYSMETYIQQKYGVKIDPSGKDISRLCFLSHDAAVYHNLTNALLPITAAPSAEPPVSEKDIKKLSKNTAAQNKNLQVIGQEPNDIWDDTQTSIAFTSGNRNNFIFKFACNCNRVGINMMDCVSFAQAACYDKNPKEVKATVESAYKANSHEFAKYKRNEKNVSGKGTGKSGGAKSPTKPTGKNDDAKDGEPPFIFWQVVIVEKGREPDKYEVETIKINRVWFMRFLFNEGFHLLKTGDSEGFQMVHSKDNIIKPVTPHDIKHYVFNWCKKYNLDEVEKMLRDGQTKYFSKNELDGMPYKDVNIKRDTEDESYIYFKNCFITINKKGQRIRSDYSKLNGYIWESSKIDHEFKKMDLNIINSDMTAMLPHKQINCEFARFVAYSSHNPNSEEEKDFAKDVILNRFLCFSSAIGYLMDGYKHPGRRTGIFAIDHQISDRFEANGRTGKSIFPQACSYFKKLATISGKSYDPKYQFCDESITLDAGIINYNDMPRSFDVETIFEKIADNYTVNRRNQGFIHFDYHTSPKVYYSTNFTPKGDGDSYKARMDIIEFSDYFSSTHTPYDEFGHGLFDKYGWDEDQWHLFYNYGLWCIALFKEGGFQKYPSPNLEARKLVNNVPPEFVEFMDNKEYVPKNRRLEKTKLQATFNEKYFAVYHKTLSAHMITSYIKQYCRSGNYTLNPKHKGGRDLSNNVEYITIADEQWLENQTDLFEPPK